MAWINEIDETSPLDTDPAAEGAEEFRNLKAALVERLASRLPGFPATQPLPILAVDIGALADRPVTPAGDGHVYIVDDPLPKRFYYGLSGAWEELTFGESAVADQVVVVSGQVLGETVPMSTPLHLVTFALPALTANHEVIGWRYRWKLPDYSSSFTAWHTTDPAASPNPLTLDPPILQLLRFEVNRADPAVKFSFKNDDTDPHDIDIEWVVTLMKVS